MQDWFDVTPLASATGQLSEIPEELCYDEWVREMVQEHLALSKDLDEVLDHAQQVGAQHPQAWSPGTVTPCRLSANSTSRFASAETMNASLVCKSSRHSEQIACSIGIFPSIRRHAGYRCTL